MIEINVPVLQKKDAIAHDIRVSLDGEVIIDEEGECLTNGFLHAITGLIGDDLQGYPNGNGMPYFQTGGFSPTGDDAEPFEYNNVFGGFEDLTTITTWDDGGTSKLAFDTNDDHNSEGEDWWVIVGVKRDGVYDNVINGKHRSFELSYPTKLNTEFDGTGNIDLSNAYIAEIWNNDYFSDELLAHAVILVGDNDEPVKPSDAVPNGMYPDYSHNHINTPKQISYGSTTRTNLQEGSGTTKYFDIVQTLTNDATSNLSIADASLMAHSSRGNGLMMGRNIVNVDIPGGSTVTLTFRIKTEFPSSGGFLKNFMDKLNGCFTYSDVYLTTLDGNTEKSHDRSTILTESDPRQDTRGIVLGTGDVSPSFTDHDLDGRIKHGESSGQLFHYGSFAEKLQIDDANSETRFDVVRLFENKSGSPIDVNQVGLIGRINNFNDDTQYDDALVTKNHLGSTTTIPDGELLKVTYTVHLPT